MRRWPAILGAGDAPGILGVVAPAADAPAELGPGAGAGLYVEDEMVNCIITVPGLLKRLQQACFSLRGCLGWLSAVVLR